jgi:thioredoxin reductase (NADPH)
MVGDEAVGGLLPAARRIDNLAGNPGGIPGLVLARRLADQAQAAGFPCLDDRVLLVEREADGGFLACCGSGLQVRSKAVCLATGTRPVRLPWDTGVSREILRDVRELPVDLHGRRVVVIGGGEAALDSALSAADRGADVEVLVRGSGATACPGLLQEFAGRGLSLRVNFPVEGIDRVRGEDTMRVHGPAGEVSGHHVMACIGREPAHELARALLGRDPESGRVSTSCPGVFMAGDVIRGRDRYVATAAGDGQQAAMAAARWIAGNVREQVPGDFSRGIS